MSTGNTETRILQMQLENKDFEEGVRQTIKSLENLEEKLNLKNAGDGFEKVSAAANSVQMSHLESGLDSVTNKFTLMGQIGLQVLERISARVVDTGEKILRAATVQPMIDGWDEFELKTNSVQTILGGIRHQFDDQPTAINAISDALDDLNQYADKTIYIFAQMTENVGKFTNQGIKLEESVNAIKGIANWAAAVGANPDQMSRAMYNISQSLGAGSMQLIDWRSIRFANMATPEVKELFVEVAKTMGMLDENGQVRYGKQVFDALNDFEYSLKGKWLTNEVMAEAFSIYANAFSETELIEKYGETIGKKFYEMGAYAEEAATKVRTFSQLIDVLKESLGSGWANTFEILFGGFEKQTEFLTAIKSRIEEIINFQTEDRNTWLQNFSDIGGIQVFQDAILTTLDILSDFYWVFNDVAALILNPFGSSVFNMTDGIFGPRQEGYTELRDTWKGVKGVFDDISNTLQNFRKWLYTPGEKSGRSPIHNLANALSGVAGVAGIAWQVLTGFGKFVFRIFKRFEPLVSSVLDLLGQIGGAIYNVFFNLTGQQSIEKVFDKIGDAIEPVIDFVVGLATAVVDLIHSFLGIDAAADDWTVLGERMKAFWEIFRYDPDLSFIDNFTNSLKKALTAVFGEDTANSIIKAWDDNVAPVLEQISGFFTNAFADLNRVLEGLRAAAEADYSQATGVKGGIGTFLTHFLKGYFGDDTQGAEKAYTDILEIYHQLKEYYDQYVRPFVQPLTKIFTETLPNLNKKIIDFLFGEEMWVANEDTEFITKERRDGLISKIKEFFASEEWEKISQAADAAIGWVKKAFDTAFDFLFGKQYDAGDGSKFRFGGMIQDIPEYFNSEEWAKTVKSVEEFFDPVIKAFDEAYKRVYAFLFGNEVIGKRGNTWREGGLFEYFTSETWQENWKLIQEGFENVKKWIEDKGNAAWNTIMTFLFGPETEGEEGKKERSGGIYQEAIKFLTPVWDWISSTGEKLYNYVTTHNFQQMWQKLNDLLFGYNEWVYNDQEMGQKVPHDGVLTPIVEMLQPIADVFNKVKGWALEKIGNIDWAGIWASIGKFFTGYDEYLYLDGKGYGYKVHHDSVFERIAGFFDRIVAWYEEHKGTFEKVFNWIGGLGGELWGAIEGLFTGKGLSGFGSVSEYLIGGAKSLFDKLFPQGANGSQSGDGGFDLMSLLFGSASADEATSGLKEQSDAIIAVVGETDKQTSTIGDVLSKIPENLQKLVGPLLGITAAWAGSKLIGAITGRNQRTFLDRITELFDSIGEIMKGLGILIGAAAISEKISPDIIDRTFDKVKDLLWNIAGMMALIGGGGVGADLLGEFGSNGIAKFFGNKNVGEITSFSDNIANFADAFKNLMDGVSVLIDDVLRFSLFDNFMDLKSGVGKVTELITEVFKGLFLPGGIMSLMTGLVNGMNIGFNGAIDYKLMQKGLPTTQRTKTTTDTLSSAFAGMATLFTAVADGIGGIITAASILVPLVPDDKFDNIVALIQKIGDVMTSVVRALDAAALFKAVNTGIEIFGVNANNADGIIRQNPSKGGSGFLAAIKGIGIATVIVAALELLAGLALWIIEQNIDSYSKTIYRAMSLVRNTLNMINTISPETTASAQAIVESSGAVLATMAQWSWSGDPISNANVFRQAGVSLAIGLEALERATRGYQNGKLTEVFGDLNLAWASMHFEEGDGKFDVADFQGKMSILERAGQGFESMAQSFRGVKQSDVDNLGIVKRYAGELNTISATLSGVSMFNAFTGFNGKSFVDTLLEMSRIGHVIRDENGEVQGLEELDGERIKGFFNEILMALPDDPQLLHKLDGFTSAGGSNLGLFASGLLSLNESLRGYRDIMVELNSGTFVSDTNVLGTIDKLGQQLDNDYDFLNNNSAQNMNTRLGIFATDLKTLAESVGIMVTSTRDASGNDYNLQGIQDLLNSVNMLGTYIQSGTLVTSSSDTLSSYVTNFSTIASSVEGLISTIHGFGFNTSDLKPIGDFLTQVAGIEQILTGYYEAMPEGNTEIHDLNEKSSFIMKSSLWMNEFIPLLSTLGQGIHDMYAPLKEDNMDFSSLGGAGDFIDSLARLMNSDTSKGIELKIVPILDDTTPAGKLLSELSMEDNYSRTITMNMNMNDVMNVRVDATQISSLITANNQTRDRIDSLASAIRGIRVQVNNVIGPNALRSGRSVQTYPLVANYQNPYEIE